jgi:circadian clock protein KaiC
VELKDVYIGPEGVLTGSLRLAQEAREEAAALSRLQEIERRQRDLERKRHALEAQMAADRGRFEAEEEELKVLIAQEQAAANRLRQNQEEMARSRKGDGTAETLGHSSRRMTPPKGRK